MMTEKLVADGPGPPPPPPPRCPDDISLVRACSMIRKKTQSNNADQPTGMLERATDQSLDIGRTTK